MAKIKVELDGKTLHAAKDVAEQLGFDLESVTRAFYRQMVREQRIPLDLSLQTPANAPVAPVAETENAAASESTAAKSDKAKDSGEKGKSKAAAETPTEAKKEAPQKQQPVPTAPTTTEPKAADTVSAKLQVTDHAAAKATNGAVSKAVSNAVSKPAPEIPPLSSIPSEDELMERMLAARDEEEEQHQIDEAVKRDAERRAKMQAEMDRAFDEAAAKRQAAAQPTAFDHGAAMGAADAAAADPFARAEQASPARTAAHEGASPDVPDAQSLADAFAAVREEGKRKAEQMEHRRAGDDAAPQSGNEHSEQPLTIDKDGTKHGGWRDSWLFEDDDPNDELLFSPWEI